MARYFIDTVKPKTAYFVYEIFPFDVVDSIESIDRLVKAVDRKQFGVHLDLVNLINCPRKYFNSGALAKEACRVLGDKIVSLHVKDILLTNHTKTDDPQPANISVILNEVPAGQGGVDLHTAIRVFNELPQDMPYLMEHMPDEKSFDMVAEYVRKVAAEVGVDFWNKTVMA